MPKVKSLLQKLNFCSPVLALLLLLVVILRIPNFFEPYWYGDEAIYLTIGNAMRNGARLYTEIVDHKTPLIYYFASVGSQLNFRVVFIFWMLLATTAFYSLACKLFTNKTSLYVASFIFAILTSLPLLEGNIPNGELFVIGFVLFGFWALSKTKYFQHFLEWETVSSKSHSVIWLVVSGIFFGLGVLTKVPAILDVAAVLTMGWFMIANSFFTHKLNQKFYKTALQIGLQMTLFMLGVAIPLILSVIYYNLRGAGQDYLNFGLLYNLHYRNTWVLQFSSPILTTLFTLRVKILIMAAGMVILTLLRKRISPTVQFISAWLLLDLFASLLSNRPYPHYFLQLVPPVALLIGVLFEKAKKIQFYFQTGTATALFLLVFAVLYLLNVQGYPTTSYYSRAYKLFTGQISYENYRNSFDGLMADNYAAAPIIMGSSDPYMFIWGTNPTLYALTGKQPTGKFTVTFHITDLNAYDETYYDLVTHHPEFVVVMRNETAQLPGLKGYLKNNYIPNNRFEHFVLWRKRSVSTL